MGWLFKSKSKNDTKNSNDTKILPTDNPVSSPVEAVPSKTISESLNEFASQKIANHEYGENSESNLFKSIISQTGFAVTIDTTFYDNPHMIMNFYLCNTMGEELFHICYEQGGIRTGKFSDSGKYFILLDRKCFYVYDMESRHISIFFPEDIENSNALDFMISENENTVCYQYTQHPDQPWYHFTFEGKLMEQSAFKGQLEKMNEDSEELKAFHAFFNELHSFPRPLSPENYERFYAKLISYSQDPNYESAWLYREIGELEMEMDKKSSALSYFKKALDLDPKIGVKRIASKLEKELEQ